MTGTVTTGTIVMTETDASAGSQYGWLSYLREGSTRPRSIKWGRHYFGDNMQTMDTETNLAEHEDYNFPRPIRRIRSAEIATNSGARDPGWVASFDSLVLQLP